jgi:superfamily II DNA/RNA helicase
VPLQSTVSRCTLPEITLQLLSLMINPLQCQKLLFSATLTRDPSKIAALHLRNPKYYIVHSAADTTEASPAALSGQQFAIPSSLTVRLSFSA